MEHTAEEMGQQPHAVNVLITESDWLRIREMVALEKLSPKPRYNTVSGFVRLAINNFLDEQQETEQISKIIDLRLRHMAELADLLDFQAGSQD